MNCRRRSLSAMWKHLPLLRNMVSKVVGKAAAWGHRRQSQAQSRMHYGR
jgi:hypothetical protein